MSPSYEGIKLNQLVNNIIALLANSAQRETFMAKLQLFNFDFSNEYDAIVFALRSRNMYRVDSTNFPRLHRIMLPEAITRVQYEILISEIEPFKLN